MVVEFIKHRPGYYYDAYSFNTSPRKKEKNPKQTEKRKETVPEGKGTEYQAKVSV